MSETNFLKNELRTNLAKIANEQDSILLMQRWGWDGRKPKTLEALGNTPSLSGKDAAVSRQRVSQIELKAKRKIKKSKAKTDTLATIYNDLLVRLPLSIIQAHKYLGQHELINQKIHIEGFNKAVDFFLPDNELVVDKEFQYVHSKSSQLPVSKISKEIVKQTSKLGIADLSSISSYEDLEANHRKVVRTILKRDSQLRFLGTKTKYLYRRAGSDSLLTVIEKIFSITDSITQTDILSQISKARNRLNLEHIPTQILIEYLSQIDFIKFHENTFTRLKTINYPFGEAYLFFLENLTTNPESFDLSALNTKWKDNGFGKTTLRTTLYKSVIIKNFGDSKFALIGEAPKNLIVQKRKPPSTQSVSEISFPEALDQCIEKMIASVNTTVKASGKTVKAKKKKRKELKMTKKELRMLLRNTLREQKFKCAISKLDLHIKEEEFNPELQPSLDRIDSQKHYEKGNLQVVCWFINRWKSDQKNDEFISLLNLATKISKE